MPNIPQDHRQVLALLGNRFVVFGSEHDHGPLAFTPERDSAVIRRVSGASESRLAKYLKVSGYEVVRRTAPSHGLGDVLLQNSDGQSILIDLKLGGGSPNDRERDRLALERNYASKDGVPVEIWRFTSDRPLLEVASFVNGKVRHETLIPLNVWETTTDGVFDRAKVVERINEWEVRLKDFYDQIAEWVADRPTFRVEQTRTVVMSEEIMRDYGVPDREVPILDVQGRGEAVASFVPRGLWILGADGRVDVIARSGTDILVHNKDVSAPGWQIVDRNRRTRLTPFDRQKFFALLDA